MKVYQKFVTYFLDAPTWEKRKDGPPLELFDRMTAEERRAAEEELLRIVSLRDNWPVMALGYLRSHKARDVLYELLPGAEGGMKVDIALALWLIGRDENLVDIAVNASRTEASPFSLINMLYSLAQFGVPETEERIVQLLDHKDELVAYNAKQALRQLRKKRSPAES
ncbi:HEAT repeat domain-containing protein [Paenibacillus sp. GCM10027626]|uniref:HEAT repeat domain-containing protein n=1 Tax=Paenibacillus sp. GCM10027626 TaxID=3273411 RepID=UPI0036419C9D